MIFTRLLNSADKTACGYRDGTAVLWMAVNKVVFSYILDVAAR